MLLNFVDSWLISDIKSKSQSPHAVLFIIKAQADAVFFVTASSQTHSTVACSCHWGVSLDAEAQDPVIASVSQ